MITLHNPIESSMEHNLLIYNLCAFMGNADVTEAELSRRTRLSQVTIHKILAGKTVDLCASTLKTLPDFFDRSIDELLSGDPASTNAKSPATAAQSIPVISWRECVSSAQLI